LRCVQKAHETLVAARSRNASQKLSTLVGVQLGEMLDSERAVPRSGVVGHS
jgi:hypothetical protein